MRKIYIQTDVEGISGVDKREMVSRDRIEPEYVIKRLMSDTNAAIEGAFLGGADHVTVLDSHSGGGNFDLGLLDKRAEFDTQRSKRDWGILDESYCGSFFIGAHAMSGTLGAFCDHTMDANAYYINGRKIGELAQWAMICTHYNVPLTMVSGDLAAVWEATAFFPGIEIVAVKKALTRNTAKALMSDDEAYEQIRKAAKEAVEKVEQLPLFRPLLPAELKVEFIRTDDCEYRFNAASDAERIDARTARKILYSYTDRWI